MLTSAEILITEDRQSRMELVTQIFIVAVVATTLLQLWLMQRQIGHVAKHRAAVPDAFAAKVELAAHQKAADYTISKTRFARLELLYGSLLLLGWTLGGGLQWLNELWLGLAWSPLWTGVAVMSSLLVIAELLGLPFALYSTFAIEQRFGFNRMTAGLFIADLVKQILLTLTIGIPLLWVILWLMHQASSLWWLQVWAVWMGFSLLMFWAYPAFIAPLFNKFQPLESHELRQRIEHLMQRCGFTSNGIFVMDGSRRSAHGNAYFTGLGQNKRIVFYDTLIDSLSGSEVEAVLAHELGHFKRRHILKRLISTAAMSLAGLALLGWLIEQPQFYHGLGVTDMSKHMALILFRLLMPIAAVVIHPLFSWVSRKHEFEADAYAAEQTNAADLIQALVKLYISNRTWVPISDGAKKWIRKSDYPLTGVPVTIKGKPIGSDIS
ncbi:MAG: M48 family metallopeptidase, partial [Gammaproteobacteria bacterium]